MAAIIAQGSTLSFAAKVRARMKTKYMEDSQESQHHVHKDLLNGGAHWVPVLYFTVVFISLWTCFALWYQNDRDYQTLCMDIYDDPTKCHSSNAWTFPTISYLGQRNPEWLIFSTAISIGAVLQSMTVYYVHRRAWSAALFDNRGTRRGTLSSEPRIFCVPLCCCTSSDSFCGTRTLRPQLKCMLKTSEILGYISAFFFFWVGWARMTYSHQLHNLCAYAYFGAGILYMPLFTLAQHQIKKKCPAKFKAPWRYIIKVTVCTVLTIIGLTYLFVILDLMYTCGEDWASSLVRRTGFPVGEYITAHFVGFYLLTHYEDIRQDNWYLQHQIGHSSIKMAALSTRPHATGNAGFQSASVHAIQPDGITTFAAPGTEI